jgi:hypothetical protein
LREQVKSDYLVEITFCSKVVEYFPRNCIGPLRHGGYQQSEPANVADVGLGMRVPPLNVVLSGEMVRDEIFVTQIAHVEGAQGCAMPPVDAPSALPNHPITYFVTTIIRFYFAAQIAFHRRNCHPRECGFCVERSTGVRCPTFVFGMEQLTANE